MKALLNLFWVFFKIGITTFGGGYAMIPIIKEQIVEKRNWMSDDDILEIIAISESTPGPIAINMATYIGYMQKKVLGSVFATIGVVVPSLIIIYIISLFFDAFIANQYVAYAFVGIKCAVAILIIKAGLNMLKKIEKKAIPILIFVCILILSICFDLFSINFSSIYLILIGGTIGLITNCIFNARKKVNE